MLSLRPWSPSTAPALRAFLEERYATSIFLLGKLDNGESVLGEGANSGNLMGVFRGETVVAAFSLLRRGNLIVSGDFDPALLPLVEKHCRGEGLAVKGVLGAWELTKGLWDHFHARGLFTSSSFESREVLYQLGAIPPAPPVPEVRFLEARDFAEWRPIRRAYSAEEGIVHELSEEDLRRNFDRYSGMKEYWGYFHEGRLVGTAALNSRALDVGQVGGVYTVPELRGRGIAKRTMRQLLSDCAGVHGLRRMILFTGEQNFPAQKVYEGLGFEKIGHFGIYFV